MKMGKEKLKQITKKKKSQKHNVYNLTEQN